MSAVSRVSVPGAGPEGPKVWAVRPPAAGPRNASTLDAAERRRAAALRRPGDRALFAAAHTALRQLLGERLDMRPAEVPLTRLPCPGCRGPHGRPAVAGAAGERLHFSLSHSGGLALIVLADRPVGVDVEQLPQPRTAMDASRALHPVEQRELTRLAGSDPAACAVAFARCWTRKEACLKATGEGLGGAGPRTLLVGTGPRPRVPAGWWVADVPVPAGYAAACALPDSAATSASASSARQHR
ncbi:MULTISPECIES: 4'-phosphopantetheinyl transferase superfamily protein [unclassified Streptomyces]|uniref:4'-phosphopantetheinyl transferase family protein n=1 Tax=unclassified Streptomyces TaxID=2593676 RepID=UPI001F044BD7|nr:MULTISPECIES: 4'-phosphopantetheinyl transferase superfamily protein [unclassified Streptomyces]